MQLLTQEIRKAIPQLYSTQEILESEKKIAVKFFTPWAGWTWYAVEGAPVYDEDEKTEIDFEFFGLVDGLEKEWGYFNLSQLEEVEGPWGLKIERDLHFKNQTIGHIVDVFA
jgi:hypothetical protein